MDETPKNITSEGANVAARKSSTFDKAISTAVQHVQLKKEEEIKSGLLHQAPTQVL